jgi:hypothetical protein
VGTLCAKLTSAWNNIFCALEDDIRFTWPIFCIISPVRMLVNLPFRHCCIMLLRHFKRDHLEHDPTYMRKGGRIDKAVVERAGGRLKRRNGS